MEKMNPFKSKYETKESVIGKNQKEEIQKLIFEMSFDFGQDLGKLSYKQLQNHIRQNHPMKNNEESWSLMEHTGHLFNFSNKRKIPKILKDIGLGASLYLLTIKSFIMFFLLISLFNIPMFLLFMSGNEVDLAQPAGIGYLFASLNIGNMGEQGPNCSQNNLASNPNRIRLTCLSGTFKNLVALGVSRDNDQECSNQVIENPVTINYGANGQTVIKEGFQKVDNPKYYTTYLPLHPECSTFLQPDLIQTPFVQNLISQFNAGCIDQDSCLIKFNYLSLPEPCIKEILHRAKYYEIQELYLNFTAQASTNEKLQKVFKETQEMPATDLIPNLFVISNCDQQEMHFLLTDISLKKQQIGLMVVIWDMILVAFLILHYNLLIYMQEDFATKYDMQTVEARDFTVVINQLPVGFHQYRSEIDMKFALWWELQEAIQMCKRYQLVSWYMDPTIIDINIIYKDSQRLEKLKEINDKCDGIERLHIQIKKFQSQSFRIQAKHDILEKCQELKELLNEYKELQIKEYDNQVSNDDQMFQASKTKRQPYYEQIKQVYITFLSMETKMEIQKFYSDQELNPNEKWVLRRINTHRSVISQKSQSVVGSQQQNQSDEQFDRVQRCRSMMDSVPLVNLHSKQSINLKRKSYEKNESFQAVSRYCRCLKRFKMFQLKKYMDIKMNDTCDPEFIIWENLGIESLTRFLGMAKSFAVLLSIVAITFLFINWFKQRRNQIFSEVLPVLGKIGLKGLTCSTVDVDQDIAFTSYKKFIAYKEEFGRVDVGKTTVEMYCFCQRQLFKDFFGVVIFADGNKYCEEWWQDYKWMQTLQLTPNAMVQIINVSSTFLFIALSKKEFQPTLTIQNQRIFLLIYIQQFISIGIVQIYTEQGFDFDITWYMTVGSSLCITVMMNIFSTKISDIGKWTIQKTRRCLDRSCLCSNRRLNMNYRKLKTFKTHSDIQSPLNKPQITKLRLNPLMKQNDTQDKDADEAEEFIPITKKLTQNELQNLYTGRQIEAGEKIAQFKNTITICFMYNLGLPLLNILMIFYFLVSYWFNKYLFLRYYQKTYQFNESLPIYAANFLKVGICLHIITTIKILRNQKLLPTKTLSEKHFEYLVEIPDSRFLVFDKHTDIYLCYVIFILLMYLFNTNVYDFTTVVIRRVLKAIAGAGNCCRRRNIRVKKHLMQSVRGSDVKIGMSKMASLKSHLGFESNKSKFSKEGGSNEDIDFTINQIERELDEVMAGNEKIRSPKQTKNHSRSQNDSIESQNRQDVNQSIENQNLVKNSQNLDVKRFNFSQKKLNSNQDVKVRERESLRVNIPVIKRDRSNQIIDLKKNQLIEKAEQSSIDLSLDESINKVDNRSIRSRKSLALNQNNKVNFAGNKLSKSIVLYSDEIDDIEDERHSISQNYFAEILFDYLELFYKQNLMEEVQLEEKLKDLNRLVTEEKLNKDVIEKFRQFMSSTNKIRRTIQNQIDFYYNHCFQDEEQNGSNSSRYQGKSQANNANSRTSSSLSDDENNSNRQPLAVKARDYLQKIKVLNDLQDENDLHSRMFTNNFRCKSFLQSYNCVHSEFYFQADLAEMRANYFINKYLPSTPMNGGKKPLKAVKVSKSQKQLEIRKDDGVDFGSKAMRKSMQYGNN